ncbi:hypothetical protein AGMMS49928_09060 [Spirochaetia bacterium]|nr:hypothetical protein AGMMS49928_09060 [Spirochaetia bacterium]
MVFGEWDQDVALEVRYEEGREEGIRLTAANLKKTGMPIDQIGNITGLSIDCIERL